MKRILFQGDSITDACRARDAADWVRALGNGYPMYCAGKLLFDHPGKYEFINRAVSGNKIEDVLARFDEDILAVKPDMMSVQIGINDVWHRAETPEQIDAARFERLYDELLAKTVAAFPDIKLMLLGAFVTKTEYTSGRWDVFSREVPKCAEAAKRLAAKYHGVFVPLQEVFDEAVKRQPEPYWTFEGVHPLEAGRELIAREYVKAFESMEI